MAKISLSGNEKSISSILNWYEDQIEALRDLKNKIINAIIYSEVDVKVNEKFAALTFDQINEYFSNSEKELQHLACFDLVSATEALLRVDFHNRIFNKDKSPIGRVFRNIYKKKANKVSLEEDIIETWKNITGDNSFSDLLSLLRYRHWLAHGRYWTPKFGRGYSFNIVFNISKNITDIVTH